MALVQLSWDHTVFKTTSALFFTKYKRDKQLVEYLKPLWFGRHAKWYERAALNLASTNNGLEGFNKDLKDKVTKRNKLAVGVFRLKMEMAQATVGIFQKPRRCRLPKIKKALQRDS